MTEHKRDFTEKTLSSQVVFTGKMLRVVSDKVQVADGRESSREYIHHPGACAVLAFLNSHTLLLERQFRYPLRRHFIELPAGKIDPGEDPLDTAKRELKEECGYSAADWRWLGTLHPGIGYTDERIELYLARGLTHMGHSFDPGELLEVFPATIPEALDWIRQGGVTDTKTIAGLLWADKIWRNEWAVA
jgi:ADP-ribose pyrophosphatase